jgi:hypothetical protein
LCSRCGSTDSIVNGGGNLTITGNTNTIGGINTTASTNGNVAIYGYTTNILNGNIYTDDGNLIINGPTTLATNIAYSAGSGNGSLIFNDALTGDFTFSVNAGSSGNITLKDVNIDTLSLVTGNYVSLDGTIETDTALSFSNLDAVTLIGDTTIIADDAGTKQNVTFGSDNIINGSWALDITGDTVTIDVIGDSNPLDSVTIAADTLIDANGNITTTGAQSFTGDMELSGVLATTDNDVSIDGNLDIFGPITINTGSGAGDIDITGTVDGALTFALTAGAGNVSIGGAVGASTPLSSFSASGASLVLADGVITSGEQIYTSAATIGGTFSTQNNNVRFLNAVTLSANTDISTDTGAGDILFNNTVDGAFDLTVDAGTGTTTFNQEVGGVTPLTDISMAGSVIAIDDMTSSGPQEFTGPIILTGDVLSTAGYVTFSDDVTLADNASITSGGGASDYITITGDVSGDYTFEIVAGAGDITLENIDVDTLTLTSGDELIIGNTITTDTAQDYTNVGTITTGANATFTANDGSADADIIFDLANVITASGDITMIGDNIALYQLNGAQQLDVTASGALTVNNGLDTTGDMSLSGNTVSLNGDLTTTDDDITISGATTLGGDTLMDTGAGAGTVTLNDTTDGAFGLTVTAGTGDFVSVGNIGDSTPLTYLDVTAANITVADVTTSGAQDYTGEVLGSGLLSGGTAVSVYGDIVMGGGVTTSSGDININGNLTLSADSILRSGGTSSDEINITGNIGGDYNLEMDAGDANITLGGDIDINQWILSSGETLTLGSGNITTDESMDFTNINDIVMQADTIFTASDGVTQADITMGPNNSITGAYNLTFNGDTVTLYGIGDPSMVTSPLTLTVNSQSFNLYGAVYTQNEQVFNSLDGLANDLITNNSDIILNSSLTLQGDVTLDTGSGAGDVILYGNVNGPYQLDITTGTGNVVSSGNFGETSPLAGISIDSSNFTLYDVTTTGDQTYTGLATLYGTLTTTGGDVTFNDAVTLADDVVISSGNSTGGEVTFLDSIDGAYDFTIDSGTADATFVGTVGENMRLGVLTVSSAADVNFSQGAYVTRFVQTNGSGSTSFGYSPGLNSLEGIAISAPPYISGRIVGTNVLLESSGSMDVEVDVDSLTIGGAGSRITGSIADTYGRAAARLVRFSNLAGGPHYVNLYNLPLVADFSSPQEMTSNQWGEGEQPLWLNAQSGSDSSYGLNPFSADYLLLSSQQSENPNADIFGNHLWMWEENVTPPMLEEAEM